MNFYELLGVSVGDKDIVFKAWRAAARVHHPDKPGGSAEHFKQLTLARDVLSNNESRYGYDLKLTRHLYEMERRHKDHTRVKLVGSTVSFDGGYPIGPDSFDVGLRVPCRVFPACGPCKPPPSIPKILLFALHACGLLTMFASGAAEQLSVQDMNDQQQQGNGEVGGFSKRRSANNNNNCQRQSRTAAGGRADLPDGLCDGRTPA